MITPDVDVVMKTKAKCPCCKSPREAFDAVTETWFIFEDDGVVLRREAIKGN